MGTSNAIEQEKKIRISHCRIFSTLLCHTDLTEESVQNMSPPRKAPKRWEERP